MNPSSNMTNVQMSGSKGHVHFGEDECAGAVSTIVVEGDKKGCVKIHLGFLQVQHKYTITFSVSKNLLLDCDLDTLLRALEESIPNVNCKVVSINEADGKFNFIVEFNAYKEKLIKEELKLRLDNGNELKLIFNARVLGQGKGTPLLKTGVKCVGLDPDEVSEDSDWQGFG